MHITLETDYAVRIVSLLCCANGKQLDAKTISDMTVVTLRFALKILRKLVVAGIVRSFKGTQGGYIIAMNPEEISLLMVIECIEGTYYFSRCLQKDGICTRGASGVCCYQKAFSQVTASVREQLSNMNFAQLIENSQEKQYLGYE